MDINDEHIEFIREDLYRRGVKLNSLAESLLDHICCAIEHHSGNHFETVYEEILERFGQDGILRIQKETSLLINSKKEAIMKRVMFSLGYIAASLITTGTLFKRRFDRHGLVTAIGVLGVIASICALLRDLGLDLLAAAGVFLICAAAALIAGLALRNKKSAA